MSGKARVWDEIPESERSQGSYQGYYRTTNRGCRAAVQWPSDPGWHQCASSAPKDIGFCPKHRVALGIASEKDLKGQDARIGNTIKRPGSSKSETWARSHVRLSKKLSRRGLMRK
jgi:hypothetical protein